MPVEMDPNSKRNFNPLGTFIALPVLALIAVSLRLFTRVFIVRSTSYDDLMVVVAMVASVGMGICMVFEVHFGLGRHFAALTLDNRIGFLKSWYFVIITYNTGLAAVKVSALLQLLRISVTRTIRRVCWGLGIFMVSWWLIQLFTRIFTCRPASAFWDLRNPNGKCVTKAPFWFSNAAVGFATDFAIVVLPMCILKDLKLPRRQKYTLIGILALGGFASVVSALRLVYLVPLAYSKNPTWDGVEAMVWTTVELNVGIICVSLAALRALVARYFPNLIPNYRSAQPSYRLTGHRGERESKAPVYYNNSHDAFPCSPVHISKVEAAAAPPDGLPRRCVSVTVTREYHESLGKGGARGSEQVEESQENLVAYSSPRHWHALPISGLEKV